MTKSKRMSSRRVFALVVAGAGVIVATAVFVVIKERSNKNSVPTVSTFALSTPMMGDKTNAVEAFATPSEPTINPIDPYNPMPLRVGTLGAVMFHRPFCPHVKRSLVNYGLPNRINYWTREQVANSGRTADAYCLAALFDCSDISPAGFIDLGNDPWCGANIDRRAYDIVGIDAAVAGKTLCSVQGHIGVFVDDPAYCVNGQIQRSRSGCDGAGCDACIAIAGQDCTVVCTACVLVTLAPLNKVTLGLGDANLDGELDINDYLYYHECYSGTSTPATNPCANVFDWDYDGDVDVDDFANFAFAYESGNKSWAAANFPDSAINPAQYSVPLRVGTEGASYYHRLDCPSVNASWNTHGISKRIDFYTWDQIDATNRVSDNMVCFAGTRENSSGSLQNCTLDDDGDGVLNCVDGCPEDQGKTAPGICGCGVPDTDGDNNGIADCQDPVVILYSNTFEIAAGVDPVDWLDTGANNSLLADPLVFSVVDQLTFAAFSTSAGHLNIHSHYVPSSTWIGYKYIGKMMATGTTDIGVTFFSDYDASDAYYRIRSWAGSSFHISPHGTTITSGNTDTLIVPSLNIWYHFAISVRNRSTLGTEIHAKIWADGDPEPTWQVHCFDNSPTKRTQGSFGVWSSSAGSRYWDDITITNY